MRKTILVVASVAVAMIVAGGVAWAANIQCPTGGIDRSGHRLCNGTQKADTMRGTHFDDRMNGRSGADTMYGRGDLDDLRAGSGPDTVIGGDVTDFLSGQEGSDKLFGSKGADWLWGAGWRGTGPDNSNDYLHGQKGRDKIFVSTDLSQDYAHSGVDRIYGDMGDDRIRVQGNAEVGDSAKEIVDCGPGTDTVYFDEGVDIVDATTCEELHPQ